MFVIKINSKHNLKLLMTTDIMFFGKSVFPREVQIKVIAHRCTQGGGGPPPGGGRG
jgi:hypothetical protein